MAELLIEGPVPVFSVGLFLLLEFRTLIRCFGFEPRREKRNPIPALIKKMYAPMLLFLGLDNVKNAVLDTKKNCF